MSARVILYRGGPVFDGKTLLQDACAIVEDGILRHVGPERAGPANANIVDLAGDILSPGFVDLQVNGGDGVMLNDAPSVDTLRRMARAHRTLGATTILPTLITDTPETTRAVIAAATEAVAQKIAGIGGLHLEGPHLSVARKGAHDASLIRPMSEDDLATLVQAARTLPALMVTIAPETTTEAQVGALANAGAIVSLGHTDASFDTCKRYAAAGARVVTHLFNAMSQLGNREPGLVGAALGDGGDVERRQEMNVGQAGVGQRREVLHAEGAGFGEGAEGAAVGRLDRRVVPAEVAHVELVDHHVLGRRQRRFRHRGPARRLQRRVVEIDDLAAGAVGGQ